MLHPYICYNEVRYKGTGLYAIFTALTWFIQASLSKFQGLFKDLSYSFQGLKVYEKSRFKC